MTATDSQDTEDAAFVAMLQENRYYSIRKLPDGTYAALGKLLFTTAIHTGLNHHGWAYRYCFDDPKLAQRELDKLEDMDDTPSGFIARRWGSGKPAFLENEIADERQRPRG